MVLGLSPDEWTAIGSLAAVGTLALTGWSIYRHEGSSRRASATAPRLPPAPERATPPASTATAPTTTARAPLRSPSATVAPDFDPTAPLPPDKILSSMEMMLFTAHQATKPEPVLDREIIGRNDPCPCGSGRKYKKCHGS